MDNNLLQIKFKQRLNKLSSMDYDNIESWQIAEAFNKAQIEWVRKQVHGNNQRKEGDESTKMAIDDLQLLLTTKLISLNKNIAERCYDSTNFPDDYLFFKRISADIITTCCPPRPLTIYLEEVADVDLLLNDAMKKPSAVWGETFATFQNNIIKFYTNNEFNIGNAKLVYYRKPKLIKFAGTIDPSTGNEILVEQVGDFKDDVVELIIDEAVTIIAGDIESTNAYQLNKQSSTLNN